MSTQFIMPGAPEWEHHAVQAFMVGYRAEMDLKGFGALGRASSIDILGAMGGRAAVEVRATVSSNRHDEKAVTHTFKRTIKTPLTWVDHLKDDWNGTMVWPRQLSQKVITVKRFVNQTVVRDPKWAEARLDRCRQKARDLSWKFDRWWGMYHRTHNPSVRRLLSHKKAEFLKWFWKARYLSLKVNWKEIEIKETKTEKVAQTFNVCPHLPHGVEPWAEQRYIVPRLEEALLSGPQFTSIHGDADEQLIHHLSFLARRAGEEDVHPSLVTRIHDLLVEAYQKGPR